MAQPYRCPNNMTPSQNPCVANGIEFGPSQIREIGEEASPEIIDVAAVQSCRLCYGPIIKHPKIQTMIGLVFASGLFVVLSWLAYGGRMNVKLGASLFVFSGVGVWMVRDAMRKYHHIEVTTSSGVSRLRLLDVTDESSLTVVRAAAANGSKLIL